MCSLYIMISTKRLISKGLQEVITFQVVIGIKNIYQIHILQSDI